MATDRFFDSSRLVPKSAYVCWLDVMGTKAAMTRSVRTSATFIGKLHIVVLEALKDFHNVRIRLYPSIDGLYIVSDKQRPLLAFLHKVIRPLVDVFLSEPRQEHRFLARGAIAYGPVVEGENVSSRTSSIFSNHKEYTRSILFGMPMIQAYAGERRVGPFGIFVHESARAFSPDDTEPFVTPYWTWHHHSEPKLDVATLVVELHKYFDWCESLSNLMEYPPEDIKRHRELAEEFFSIY